MKKINLSIYKQTKVFFILFDYLLKDLSINKESYLIMNNISPSSYRRARKEEQKIGLEIKKELTKKFNKNEISDELIDEIEKRFNDIYYSVYYKIYDKYEEDIKYLNDLLEKEYIIFPIIKLFKLFMIMNDNSDAKKLVNSNYDLFLEVIKYKDFYTEELKEICELLEIVFEEKSCEVYMGKKYENGMNYYALSSNLWRKKKYIESLYFAKIGKEKFIQDGNYKRVFHINHNIMNSLVSIGNYEECYEMALQAKRAVKSLEIKGYLEKSVNHFIVISGIPLKKYQDIIDFTKDSSIVTMTIAIGIMISKYFTNINEYNNYLLDLNLDELENDMKQDIINIDLFLKEKNRRYLNKLSDQVAINLVEVLKKLDFN